MDHERGQNEQIIAGIEKIETMSDNSLPDIANMNIKSRINKKTQDFSEEPLTNGLHNGICNSQKNISVDHNLLPGTQSMETSHLNKLGKSHYF